MRIAICDDDMMFCTQLEQWVWDFFAAKKLEQPDIVIYELGEDVLRDTNNIDIAFLDVELSGLSGIFTGRDLMRKYKKVLVFIITAFPEYLDEAMRFNAFRYLSKPLDKNRLYRNLQDAIKIYTTANAKVAFQHRSETITIYTREIIYIEAREHHTVVHTTAQDYISTDCMEFWIAHLDMHCFFRTHRSYIVSLEYVLQFSENTIYLYDGQMAAYLTKRRYKDFKKAYLLYLEGQGR